MAVIEEPEVGGLFEAVAGASTAACQLFVVAEGKSCCRWRWSRCSCCRFDHAAETGRVPSHADAEDGGFEGGVVRRCCVHCLEEADSQTSSLRVISRLSGGGFSV